MNRVRPIERSETNLVFFHMIMIISGSMAAIDIGTTTAIMVEVDKCMPACTAIMEVLYNVSNVG